MRKPRRTQTTQAKAASPFPGKFLCAFYGLDFMYRDSSLFLAFFFLFFPLSLAVP